MIIKKLSEGKMLESRGWMERMKLLRLPACQRWLFWIELGEI